MKGFDLLMRKTKKALSLLLSLVMVLAMIPAFTLTFNEKAKAYSTYTKGQYTEYYYPAGTYFVKNIYVAWWGSGNADNMAGIVGCSGDYYIETNSYHTRHYSNHSGAVWDKDLNRGCGGSSDDVYIGYDFTTDPTAANVCKGIRYDHNGSAPSTMTSSGVTWWKCNTGDNATYAPKKGPDGAADLNSGCGSKSDDIKIYATYDRSFGPPVSILSVTDSDDGEPHLMSGTAGWTDAVTFQDTSYCLDLNKSVSGSHDLWTHYYTPCVALDSNTLRANYNALLAKYNQIGYYTYPNTTKANIESALTNASNVLADLNDGFTSLYTQATINTYANTCKTQADYMSLTHSISYNLNGGTASGNPTTFDINSTPVKLNNPTKFGYTFTGWTGSNGSTPQTTVEVPNVLSSGLSQYTTSNPYTAGSRDHVFGNSFPVVSGETYRVFVTAKRTAGSLNMNGGIWYSAGQTYGNSWDGVGGAFTYLRDAGNGWGVYYKDVTVPNGKQRGQFYMQLEQWDSDANKTTWLLANPMVFATGVSLPVGLETYKTTNPYTCSGRDHQLGNAVHVTPGKTYRVWVTAKRTAGDLALQGGMWYFTNPSGTYGYDGYGAFTKFSDYDGWSRYYRDVTVPAGKDNAKVFIQINQASSGGTTTWQVADMAIVDRTIPNLSFTANWTPTNHTISYNLNGGTASGNPTSYNIESSPVKLNNPTRAGYTFKGWTGANGMVSSTDVSAANVVSSGINYTTSNYYTASQRDHYFGNAFPVLPGMTYRVYVTAKQTAGSLPMQGGIRYNEQAANSGNPWDGYAGAFTKLRDVGDGWALYYKDVTVPVGKLKGQFYVQLDQYSPYGTTWLLANCFVTTRFESLPIGLEQYTTSNPLVCSGRDHRPGNQVPVEAGKVYRVYVTAKRTAGSRALQGGLWYNTNASGYGYDGYGAFTLQYDYGDGWGRYYRDVTVPAGKNNPTVFIQIDQSSSTGFDTTWQCADMAIADLALRDISYTANWQANTYTVAYNGNGATSGSTASSSHTYDEAKNLTANGFARTGYDFAGWASSETGAVAYSNSQSVTNLTASNGATVNLYAKWTGYPYTVAFSGNGATSGSMSNQSFVYGTAQNLNANAFSRAYTVTYKYNNGAADGSATATYTFKNWVNTSDTTKTYHQNLQR